MSRTAGGESSSRREGGESGSRAAGGRVGQGRVGQHGHTPGATPPALAHLACTRTGVSYPGERSMRIWYIPPTCKY